ncbi:ATP-dependent RNA helicase ddx52 [Plakobranchus ocellatus]|uniref:ATP-dependent RNA helicase ddx52 n=1 Tax=Plakobranchus ocellatus TaxID=259542 RepID=A0AAV4CPA8_9GAST|nr:ATP-dependent RNA helicase ddx52 [Plakobranchus ocellatus]
MEGSKLFWKLGAFAKFDFKRFGADAQRLKVIKSKPVPTERKHVKSSGLSENMESQHKIANGDRNSLEKKKRRKKKKKQTPAQAAMKKEEEVRQLRNKCHIHVLGTDIPDPLESFEQLSKIYYAQPQLLQNIENEGYKEPTAIQRQAIPIMMQERDIMACAPTGSGKTAAFILPILHHLKETSSCGVRAVILAPTRELAKQILMESRKLSKGSGLRSCYIEKKATAVKKSKKQFVIITFNIIFILIITTFIIITIFTVIITTFVLITTNTTFISIIILIIITAVIIVFIIPTFVIIIIFISIITPPSLSISS